ncbi:complex 1 protein, LYR family protein (macronuclear) [Tetrahymena thermophila SB210]|uniref:Complex 1 protein, LYR family protein n=1 Tax=Tetrahymena thermophila (strain SB210) TaxID=312017 RepID=I7MGI4_TETTS|nr:complex 1 protein, LYR family protein [Tetrahymena thermophila SB210]EAS01473.1 complex 1 protein, LYR family protein [Tetrahymena thermophila SB210]|eukprot:XP_001021719.1 complex 1 protein, LYR family protein [Tetrahymena thermophila SB210]
MSTNSLADVANLTTKTIYRLLLKNMKYYPSKNRFQIMMAIREEFRENKQLTDEKKIKIERKKARIGLAHVLMYKDKGQEFVESYRIKDDPSDLHFNPRDKDFIYF